MGNAIKTLEALDAKEFFEEYGCTDGMTKEDLELLKATLDKAVAIVEARLEELAE